MRAPWTPFDARSVDPFLPNAAILRSAEAVDAVLNAARSGAEAESSTASAGYILCSITQLGGVLYVLFILVIALVLLAFLPVVNFFFQLFFDTASAGVAIAAGNPKLESNASASGGSTAVGDRLLAGAAAFGEAARRRKFSLPRRRGRRTGASAGAGAGAGGAHPSRCPLFGRTNYSLGERSPAKVQHRVRGQVHGF